MPTRTDIALAPPRLAECRAVLLALAGDLQSSGAPIEEQESVYAVVDLLEARGA